MIFQSKNASLQSESTNNQIVMESHTNRSKSGGKPASKKSQSVCRAKPRTKRRTPFHVALPRPGLAHQLSIIFHIGYTIRQMAKILLHDPGFLYNCPIFPSMPGNTVLPS